MAHLWLCCTHTFLGPCVSTYCLQTESPLSQTGYSLTNKNVALGTVGILWDHPKKQTKTVEAEADLQFYFRLAQDSCFKSCSLCDCRWGVRLGAATVYTTSSQTGRVTFTSHSVTVDVDVCATRQKYSWLGHQTEIGMHECVYTCKA